MPLRPRSGRRHGRPATAGWLVVAVLCVSALVVQHVAAGGTPSPGDVADQILALQDKADAAAAQWTDLDDESRDIADQVTAMQQSVDAATATTGALQATLAQIAMDKYTGALPQVGLPFTGSLMADVQTDALTEFALGTGAVDLDQFAAAQRDLARKQQDLARLQARNDDALRRLQTTRDNLDAQIGQLQTLEQQLQDAEVKKAYDAKLAASRQRQADAAAAADAASASSVAAEASAATVVQGGRGGGTGSTAESPALSPTSQAALPLPATATATTTTTSPQGAAATTTAPAGPASTAAGPATATSTTPPPAAPAAGGLVCPVAGTNAFGDTWGDARPGGRHHEGVDMISPFGTPVVAIADGFATMHVTSLGGNSIGLKATDGTYYFYAHLSSWVGPSRAVHAGEVIGHVGHTGDTTVNHLHFEVHPGGGPAIDPYPTVRRIC
jgi:murein DD-endopeptidase MepM/ murein hydrolase activator NlpD